MKLTQQQLEQFDHEVTLTNLFSAEEAAFLKGEAERSIRWTTRSLARKGVARTAFFAHRYNGICRLGSTPSYRARRATSRWQGVHAPIQSQCKGTI